MSSRSALPMLPTVHTAWMRYSLYSRCRPNRAVTGLVLAACFIGYGESGRFVDTARNDNTIAHLTFSSGRRTNPTDAGEAFELSRSAEEVRHESQRLKIVTALTCLISSSSAISRYAYGGERGRPWLESQFVASGLRECPEKGIVTRWAA